MNEFELHVIDDFAFFSNPTELGRSDHITINYHGEDPADLVINGEIHRIKDGTVDIDMDDLVEGLNICQVLRNKITISCEGIAVRGGYPLPAGITNKSLVLAICEELKEKRELCQELQQKLDAVAVEERKEDLFSF